MYTPQEHKYKPYTIDRLIERLEDIRSMLGEDVEVRIMSQQKYPFEYTIKGLAESDNFGDGADPNAPVVVYFVEGAQIGYGSRDAWDAAER